MSAPFHTIRDVNDGFSLTLVTGDVVESLSLVSGGGPGSQNCEAESKVNGVMFAQPGTADGRYPRAKSGLAMGGLAGTGFGCGRHLPGPVAGV